MSKHLMGNLLIETSLESGRLASQPLICITKPLLAAYILDTSAVAARTVHKPDLSMVGAGVLPVGGQGYAGVPGTHDVIPRGPPRDLPGGAHLARQHLRHLTAAVQHLAVSVLACGDAAILRGAAYTA